MPETVDDLGSITQTAPMYYEVACFGGDEITFQARIGSSEVGCDQDPPWGVDPLWLDPCKRADLPRADRSVGQQLEVGALLVARH